VRIAAIRAADDCVRGQIGYGITTMKIILAASVAASLGIGAADAATRESLTIARTETAPALAGYEHVARDLGRVSDFRQREPNDGDPATFGTVADVTFDRDTLYVTFICQENPASVRAHLSRRDDISGDDYVAVALDTFHDGRHAYVFKANALGVQRDGIITEGDDDDYSFDAVWEAEGRLTATGYIVRFAIPFRSLRYASRGPAAWGIALSRYVPSRAEMATWPHITSRIDAYVPQFATLEGLANLPSDHLADLTPYVFGAAERAVDPAQPLTASSAVERRVGVDAKVVIASDWTVDFTVHPDFSQVESDQPQVTANQRYEVYFPEKRPFFTDRASFFNTPEPLFFSRRVVDPVAGGRVTGIAGAWTVGALFVADGANGASDAASSAMVTIARAQRAIHGESSIGATASFLENGSAASSRVVSMDARLKLSPNWIATLQATESATRWEAGDPVESGTAMFAELRHEGRHLKYHSSYRDRTPEFAAPLGFVTRTDLRQVENSVAYFFRRTSGPLIAVIPTVSSIVDWDFTRRMQDASLDTPLWFDFKGPVSAAVGQTRAREVYRGIDFRRDATYVTAYGDLFHWLGFNAYVRRGTGINFYPAAGQAPSLGDAQYDAFDVTLRPSSRWRIAESYIVSRLAAPESGAEMLADRYLRLKSSVQVSRALSLRAIVDRHALNVDPRAVADVPDRRYTFDVLLTYLVQPGSAIYVGFTDRSQDVSGDSALPPDERALGRVSTGRQVFVKITRMLQF
jgi:uncharacterized protein DUF5916